MLLVHVTWQNALELFGTGAIFGFGWAVGHWVHVKTLGKL